MKRLTELSCLLAASMVMAQTPVRTTRDKTVNRVATANPLIWNLQYAEPEPGNDILVLDPTKPTGARISAIGHQVGTPLLAFAHFTDPQIVDDASPARFPFIDRLADDLWNPGYYTGWDTGSAYRPQERLSMHMADAMVRAIRNVGSGPLTGLPLKFTITTGDMADNSQENEVQWAIQLLDGGLVTPHSGGAVDESTSTISTKGYYWKPDSQAGPLSYPGQVDVWDNYKAHGFPTVPGFVAASRVPFQATGLGMPWYDSLGNHDVLVQGNAPRDMLNGSKYGIPISWAEWWEGINIGTLRDLAVRSNVIRDLDSSVTIPRNFDNASNLVPSFWSIVGGDVGNKLVMDTQTPDPNRQLLDRKDIVAYHFNTTGSPAGHGFVQGSDKGYYAIPSGDTDLFQFISLDSNNTNGFGSNGWIDNDQVAWLETQLRACSSRYRTRIPTATDPESWYYQPSVKDKMVVLYCHHPLSTMNNVTVQPAWTEVIASPSGAPPITVYHPAVPLGIDGTQLEAMLLRFPNVVLVVNGHTHNNRIVGHQFPNAIQRDQNGFWEVTTSSVIDWPCQSRIIEFSAFENNLMIHTTMVNADADLVPQVAYPGLNTPRALASWAQWLAANDPQEHPVPRNGVLVAARGGDYDDRNAELALPLPFPLPGSVPSKSATLAATPKADTRVELFGVGPSDLASGNTNSMAYHTSSWAPGVDDHFSPWQSLNGGLTSVAAGNCGSSWYGNGLNFLVGVDSSENIWFTRELPWCYYAHDSYGAWQLLDGALTSVAVTQNWTGNPTIFGTWKRQTVFRRSMWNDQGCTWPTISGWNNWAAFPYTAQTVVTAATNSNGAMQVFGIAMDGSWWSSYQTNIYSDYWSDWFTLDGSLKAISATRRGDGRLELFGIEKYTGHLMHRSQIVPGSYQAWSPWEVISVGAYTQVTSSVRGDGRVAVYAVNPAGMIFSWTNEAVWSNTFGNMTQIDGSVHP